MENQAYSEYENTCCVCKKHFTGPRHAVTCYKCFGAGLTANAKEIMRKYETKMKDLEAWERKLQKREDRLGKITKA